MVAKSVLQVLLAYGLMQSNFGRDNSNRYNQVQLKCGSCIDGTKRYCKTARKSINPNTPACDNYKSIKAEQNGR